MYRNAYQRGMLTILFSGGAKPLEIWETRTQDGYIIRFLDQDIKSMVLEIGGTNVSTTYMICPKGKTVLGITMPFLVMIVKNLKKYFSFEVTILDETSTRRRFRVSNFQSTTQILPLCTVMPIGLSDGWNQIQFNLAEFTRRAYKKQFVEVQKLKINANIRLRRIYFTERLIPEDQLPPEYKLYFPLPSKGARNRKQPGKEEDKENIKPSTSQQISTETPVVQTGSKLEVAKPSSKVSVHTIKRSVSQERKKSSKDLIEQIVEEPVIKTAASTEGKCEVGAESQEQQGENATSGAETPEAAVHETIPEDTPTTTIETAPGISPENDTTGTIPQSGEPAEGLVESLAEEASANVPTSALEESPVPAEANEG